MTEAKTSLPNYLESLSFNRIRTLTFSGDHETRLDEGHSKLGAMLRNVLERFAKQDIYAPSRRAIDHSILEFQTETHVDFNSHAKEVACLDEGSAAFSKLVEILNIECDAVMSFMCFPIFRDALILEKIDSENPARNDIVGILGICFECSQINKGDGEEFDVGQSVFNALQTLLRSLGHQDHSQFYDL